MLGTAISGISYSTLIFSIIRHYKYASIPKRWDNMSQLKNVGMALRVVKGAINDAATIERICSWNFFSFFEELLLAKALYFCVMYRCTIKEPRFKDEVTIVE